MVGEQLGVARHQFDFLVYADINLRKVVLIEVALQHLTTLQDILFLQLTLRTKDIPGRIQFLVLLTDGLLLTGLIIFQGSHILIQLTHLFIQLGNMDILGFQFLTQHSQLTLLGFQLGCQVLKRLAQLLAGGITVAQAQAQLIDEVLVLGHRLVDKLHILTDTLSGIGTLATTLHRHATLSLVDSTETILNGIEGFKHIINLVVLLYIHTIQ